jgi:hypothetical protein
MSADSKPETCRFIYICITAIKGLSTETCQLLQSFVSDHWNSDLLEFQAINYENSQTGSHLAPIR